MELGLFQQQTMKLVMTQELRQAITILQYSRQELTQFIREQAMENPLIDLQEPSFEGVERFSPSYGNVPSQKTEDYNPFDFIKADQGGMVEDLLEQARYLNVDETTYKRLTYLIWLLDDDGYLPTNIVDETAEELRLPKEEIERVLSFLQQLEPPGIGARDLKECLLLQIHRIDPDDRLAKKLVTHYLPLLAERKWERLAEELSVSREEVRDAAELIRGLQPKPGSVYHREPLHIMQPDLTIEKVEGRYRVILHDDFLPTIRPNRQYDALLTKTASHEASQYIREKYKQMTWLMKSIEQRRATLINVTEMIARRQTSFLEKGPHHLAPLTLREVADELDIHESTVSRAVRGKSVQTPVGLYELRSFFTSKVNTADGEGTSSTSVKLVIKELIEKEDPKKPLSDQKIATVLKEQHDIAVSRRTVAKYRDQLNIPSSTKRKTSSL